MFQKTSNFSYRSLYSIRHPVTSIENLGELILLSKKNMEFQVLVMVLAILNSPRYKEIRLVLNDS